MCACQRVSVCVSVCVSVFVIAYVRICVYAHMYTLPRTPLVFVIHGESVQGSPGYVSTSGVCSGCGDCSSSGPSVGVAIFGGASVDVSRGSAVLDTVIVVDSAVKVAVVGRRVDTSIVSCGSAVEDTMYLCSVVDIVDYFVAVVAGVIVVVIAAAAAAVVVAISLKTLTC